MILEVRKSMKKNVLWVLIGIVTIALVSAVSFFIFNKDYVRTGIKDVDLNRAKKLMVVAHPDDETIWGGSHLLKDDYLVVCVTCGRNKIRNHEIEEAMKISKDQVIMLGYPDKTFGKRNDWHSYKKQIEKDLNRIINSKNFELIATHNPNGEYGHVHHQMTSQAVTDVVRNNHMENKLIYFGKYYSKKIIGKYEDHLEEIDNRKEKNKMLEVYKSQAFIHDYFGQMFKHEMWIPFKDWK